MGNGWFGRIFMVWIFLIIVVALVLIARGGH
jgi:hypothetical protein